jgi:hypothetical protein
VRLKKDGSGSQMTNSDEMVFGFPDFAATVFAAHGPKLRLAYADSHLANKMFAKLPSSMTKQQIVIICSFE